MTFILNLFGTGIRYWICEIPLTEFEDMDRIRQYHQVEWEQLLFDFDFLKRYGYKHWSALSPYPEQTGFFLDPQNRIEIKQGAKFIARFRANELMNQETLFPVFNTSQHSFDFTLKEGFQQLLLIQYEKGLITKYRIPTDSFNIDVLKFEISNNADHLFISRIEYDNQDLKKTQEDSIVVGSKVIFL